MSLAYVGEDELRHVLAEPDRNVRAAAFADACRLNVLYMVSRAGAGHLGSSFSCLDLLAWLHLEVLEAGDRCFSSKGHDAPATYAVLAALGRIDFELIHGLRRLDGLPGHPDVTITPQVWTSTGSLGMGVSKAQGMVVADRAAGRRGRVFVITGDGELQEGQFWESLGPAANRGMGEITVCVDANGLQSDTWVAEVSALGDVAAKARAFGWATDRCDGHDLADLDAALARLAAGDPAMPRLLVAETCKGAGVSFMEATTLPRSPTALYAYHSGAPAPHEQAAAVAEVHERLQSRLRRTVVLTPAPGVNGRSRPRVGGADAAATNLVTTYADALLVAAEREPRLVALSADLRLDCGLEPFARRFPDRFVECGIAEQHMVSQAGTMALGGLLPVAHSFASFLGARANEQIYNNATEGTRVIYTATLAGLVPAGPGHSHQAVRDIALLSSVPGLDLLEPATPGQLRAAVAWAVDEAPGSVYLRLVSVPCPSVELPDAPLVRGRGRLVRDGDDSVIVAAGPLLLVEALRAAEMLDAEGIGCAVLSLPWLRAVDGAWLGELLGDRPVLCLDNHHVAGGQGSAVLGALAASAPAAAARTAVHGVLGVPRCGTNAEALRAHALDAEGIAAEVRAHAAAALP